MFVPLTSIAPPQELGCCIQAQYSALGLPSMPSLYVSWSLATSIAMICRISVCTVVSTLPFNTKPSILKGFIGYLILIYKKCLMNNVTEKNTNYTINYQAIY